VPTPSSVSVPSPTPTNKSRLPTKHDHAKV
jgi:hypothetical protein